MMISHTWMMMIFTMISYSVLILIVVVTVTLDLLKRISSLIILTTWTIVYDRGGWLLKLIIIAAKNIDLYNDQ